MMLQWVQLWESFCPTQWRLYRVWRHVLFM